MTKIIFHDSAWEDYWYWQSTDKAIARRVNELFKVIRGNPSEGIGKPEPLKHQLAGYWSRRIDREHRLIYTVADGAIIIAQCRYHY